ncbi:hypothetical protein VmeM32_00024 [Vibrio phage vB_VmeM-32]|nr:hypothetical protein VmeM32_00024 [Vibrio phage vB_VmeM-32]
MNHVDMYWWMMNHPQLNNADYYIQPVIEIMPFMVDPEIDEINLSDLSKNTKPEWWIEVSGANKNFDPFAKNSQTNEHLEHEHVTILDCGADTIEEAIGLLYDLTMKHFGSY